MKRKNVVREGLKRGAGGEGKRSKRGKKGGKRKEEGKRRRGKGDQGARKEEGRGLAKFRRAEKAEEEKKKATTPARLAQSLREKGSDRKRTSPNSSHAQNSYSGSCLTKKNN